MRDLDRLGFQRYRLIEASFVTQFYSRTGFSLPSSYLEFLCHRQPMHMPLLFRFIRTDGEEWEGCISEFCNIAPNSDQLDDLSGQLVQPKQCSGRTFLPIGSDAGGNYLYLDLSTGDSPVIDVDYASGLVSQVAIDFETFVAKLQAER